MPLAQPGPSCVAGSLAVGGWCGRFVDAGISEPVGPLRPPPTAQVFLRHAPQPPRRCTGTASQGLSTTSSPFQRRAEQEHPPRKGPQPAAWTPGPGAQTPGRRAHRCMEPQPRGRPARHGGEPGTPGRPARNRIEHVLCGVWDLLTQGNGSQARSVRVHRREMSGTGQSAETETGLAGAAGGLGRGGAAANVDRRPFGAVECSRTRERWGAQPRGCTTCR